MTSTLLDRSHTAMPRYIQENLIAYMRLFAGLPGIACRDDDEAFWLICKDAPGSSILRARWPAGRAEAGIDALFAQVGQHLDEIDWMVFPGDQPADLGQRLEARGMPGGRGGNWLWADLRTLGAAPTTPDGFRLERVRDDRALAVWLRVSETGFGSSDLAVFYDAYARHGYGDDAFSLHYIGYLGDTPVTSGTLLDAGGGASIYDISTPPEFRGQGFGGAITHALMREIYARGYRDTWMWSSNMAQSVYRKLGFVDAEFGLREYHWRK